MKTARWLMFLMVAGLICPALFALDESKPSTTVVRSFGHSEYFKATTTGQKKAEPSVKGTLIFNSDKKTIDFLDEKKSQSFCIKYDSVKSLVYEKASKPRYAEAVLVSPLFLLSHAKKHYLTIQYMDDGGNPQFAIVRLDKSHAREAAAAAEAETGKKVEMVEEK